MTINGILVALTGCELAIPLVESHPKLLLRAALKKDPKDVELAARHHAILEGASSKATQAKADDMADALVAAWCASRWWFNRWPNDLFTTILDDLTFPAGAAVYPWPEPVGLS
jgi:predicted RNase H-like nuclease